MLKVSDVTTTADQNGEFTNGVVAQGLAPTIIDAQWLNAVQRELVNAVEGSGQMLDKTDFSQLAQALQVASVKRYPFNQAFSTAIGGYPKGAIILGIDGVTLWQSTIDSNITDPDSAGASGWRLANSRFPTTKIFESSGSFTVPAGVTKVRVRVVGGGGGSAGGNASAGGVNNGGVGKAGGASSFGNLISATGGGGAGTSSNPNFPSEAGQGSGGYINISGMAGMSGSLGASGAYANVYGGSSHLGGQTRAYNENPRAATEWGGGGAAKGSIGVSSGAAGAHGVVIVEW